MPQYDIYPGFSEVFPGKPSIVFSMFFVIIMLIPFIFDTAFLLDIKGLDKMVFPVIIPAIAFIVEAFVIDYFVQRNTKPLRFSKSAVFIPNWLLKNEVIISNEEIEYITCEYYVVRNKTGSSPFCRRIILHGNNNRMLSIELIGRSSACFSTLERIGETILDVKFRKLENPLNYQLFSQSKATLGTVILISTSVILTLMNLFMMYIGY